MIAGQSFGVKLQRSFLAKVPTWVWWILLYILMVGSNYFMTDATINQFSFMQSSVDKGAETGNMLWMHFVSGLVSVLVFELINNLFAGLVLSSGRMCGGFEFTKKDFTTLFRLFYFPVLMVSGLLQLLYYYFTVSVVFGSILFVLILRVFMMIGFFFYFKKKFLNEYNKHYFLKALFVPYFVFEIVSIGVMFFV